MGEFYCQAAVKRSFKYSHLSLTKAWMIDSALITQLKGQRNSTPVKGALHAVN